MSTGGLAPPISAEWMNGPLHGPGGSSRLLLKLFIVLVILMVLLTILWLVFYYPSGIGFGTFLLSILTKIVNIILWPFQYILQLLGISGSSSGAPPASTSSSPPSSTSATPPSTTGTSPNTPSGVPGVSSVPPSSNITPAPPSTIIHQDISDCPPCNCSCECPTCTETDVKPYVLEIKYLKDMVKMIGAIARRENAMNSQYRELYPGFSVMSPHVRKMTFEYKYMKDEIKKDEDEWNYFKNYFSRLSGIPSTSETIHYDLVL